MTKKKNRYTNRAQLATTFVIYSCFVSPKGRENAASLSLAWRPYLKKKCRLPGVSSFVVSPPARFAFALPLPRYFKLEVGLDRSVEVGRTGPPHPNIVVYLDYGRRTTGRSALVPSAQSPRHRPSNSTHHASTQPFHETPANWHFLKKSQIAGILKWEFP